MPRGVYKRKERTAVSIVFEALIRADDFRTGRQLVTETGVSGNRVSAALYNLKRYKAAEFVESDEQLWWFATPNTDTRSHRVEEKVPESRPRRPRKKKTLAK